MLYGLQGYTDLRPQQVFPANLFLYDIRQTAQHDGRGGKVSNIFHRDETTITELCESKVKCAYNAVPQNLKIFPLLTDFCLTFMGCVLHYFGRCTNDPDTHTPLFEACLWQP
jgi:hypothetical protein